MSTHRAGTTRRPPRRRTGNRHDRRRPAPRADGCPHAAARAPVLPASASLGRWSVQLLVAVAVLAFAVLAAGPHLLGYRTMTTLTASMAPAIDPGDGVVTHRVIDVNHALVYGTPTLLTAWLLLTIWRPADEEDGS